MLLNRAEDRGSSLQSIMQDSKGFIWIGTSSGIYRFDGISYSAVAGG